MLTPQLKRFIDTIRIWQSRDYRVKIHVLKLYSPYDDDNYYTYAALFIKNNILEQIYLHQNYTTYNGPAGGTGNKAYREFEDFLRINPEIQVTKESYELYSKLGEGVPKSEP